LRAVQSYGVSARRTLDAEEASRIAEEVRYCGYAVAEGALKPAEVAELCDLLDSVYQTQCVEVGGEDILHELHDADIVRCPLAYEAKFLDLARHPLIVEVAGKLLGHNVVLLMQNGIINRPNRPQAQSAWHRDLNYQHWVASKPLAIGALVCLEDFSEITGATKFLPGSHKFEEFPAAELIDKFEVGIDAPRGSILFFDAMTFHRAGVNTSDRIRRAVNHVIGVPILCQQIDIPSMLHDASPGDPWLAGYLGFRWNPAESVRQWRLNKRGPNSATLT
jgi:ectoine hydroxylase-related dioxygenase (phytanoyl-CoA dioxygenase family)